MFLSGLFKVTFIKFQCAIQLVEGIELSLRLADFMYQTPYCIVFWMI